MASPARKHDLRLIAAWFRAFVLTLLIEEVVAVPLLGSDISRSRRAVAVGFAQVLSHPAVWFIWPLLFRSRTVYLAVAEGWAVLAEFVFYWFLFPNSTKRRTLGVAVLANAVSVLGGLAVHYFSPTFV